MSENERKADELEQLLRDERALRIRAETRAAAQAEKTEIWRTRAEERAARIQKLTAAGKRSRRRKPAAQPPAPPSSSGAADTPAVSSLRPARLASARAAIAVQPENQLTLSALATDEITSGRGALAEADQVIVDTASLDAMAAATRDSFTEWLRAPARQPLVVLTSDSRERDVLRQADAVFATTPETLADLRDSGIGALALDPVFDPAIHNPIGRTWQALHSTSRETSNGIPVVLADGALVGIEAIPASSPPAWLIEAAAQGIPLSAEQLDPAIPSQFARASAAARRWAYRHHTPTMRAAHIVATAGISVPNPLPTAAAILVSMRPNQAVATLNMMKNQTYRPLSVVVGLHGATPTPVPVSYTHLRAHET